MDEIKQELLDLIGSSPGYTLGMITWTMQQRHNPENDYNKDCELGKEILLAIGDMITNHGLLIGTRGFYTEGSRTTFTFSIPPKVSDRCLMTFTRKLNS